MLNKKLAGLLSAALLLAGCSGTIPQINEAQRPGKAAVVASSQIEIEGGPARSGTLTLGLRGEEENSGIFYRLVLPANKTSFYEIEPGTYRLSAPLSFFGFSSNKLNFSANGQSYWAPWPQILSDKGLMVIRPGEVLSIGVLKAALWTAPPSSSVSLDNSVQSRRALVQDVIKEMDPTSTDDIREMSLSWMDALQSALTGILSDKGFGTSQKSAPQ